MAAVTAGGFGPATGAFSGNTGNANFNSVLNQFNYDGGPKVITLYNLFIGQQYAVQLFGLDGQAGAARARSANYQDPNDAFDISTTFAMGDVSYIVGTFTTSNTTVDIQENLPTGASGNINVLVIRALGVIIAPTITTPPASVTIDQGLTTTFTVAASGTAPLTYRWQRGVVGSGIFTNVPANARYSGLTGVTLTISNLAVADSADYRSSWRTPPVQPPAAARHAFCAGGHTAVCVVAARSHHHGGCDVESIRHHRWSRRVRNDAHDCCADQRHVGGFQNQ